MSHPACLALAFLLAVVPLASGQSDEPLRPEFVDETLRDPFLTPVKSQISGPLDGERLEEDWSREYQTNGLSAGTLFSDSSGDSFTESGDCTDTSPVAQRRIPIMDSGITATWLAPVDGFGISDVDARTSLIFPLFVKGSPLRLSMSAGTTFINAPAAIDAPSRLYGLQAELRWYIPLRETWGIDLGAGGGVYSDLNGTASEGFRVTGRAILVKEINPQWNAQNVVVSDLEAQGIK